MNITIRTIGNPALYKSVRDSLASETRHRTTSGAARRLLRIERQSKRWTECVGQWGKVEVEVDGRVISRDDMDGLDMAIDREMTDPVFDALMVERTLGVIVREMRA